MLGNPTYDQNQMDEAMAEEYRRGQRDMAESIAAWLDCENYEAYGGSFSAYLRYAIERGELVQNPAKPRER
jgi:hypothetical protein